MQVTTTVKIEIEELELIKEAIIQLYSAVYKQITEATVSVAGQTNWPKHKFELKQKLLKIEKLGKSLGVDL